MMTTTTAATPTAATLTTTSDLPGSGGRLLWLDAVRASALFVVVIGHFLMAVVTVTADGDARFTNVLDVSTWSHWLTWPLQVMPVFFAVGAVVTAAKLRGASQTGEPDGTPSDSWSAWAQWMGRRSRALIVPAIPLLGVWVLVATPLAASFGAATTSTAASAALVPLWFLAVYVVVQALVPLWIRVIRRHHPAALGVGLVALVAAVDAAHLAGVPAIGYANFILVWSLPTLLGVVVQDGRLTARQLGAAALGAVGVAALLILAAGYALPVVGVTDAARSNNSPPTLLLACHAVAYASVVLALGPRLEAVLRRGSRRQRVLRLASDWSMPVYLWHMTGLVVLVAVGISLPVPGLDHLLGVEVLTGTWWALRPVWVLACLLPTAALIGLVRLPSGRLSVLSAGRGVADPIGVVVGLLGCSLGIGMIVENGIAPTPVVPLLLLSAGLIALHPHRASSPSARG